MYVFPVAGSIESVSPTRILPLFVAFPPGAYIPILPLELEKSIVALFVRSPLLVPFPLI